jgi:hypothetical protein
MPGLGRQRQRLLCLVQAPAGSSRRANAARLPGGPARIYDPCRPLRPARVRAQLRREGHAVGRHMLHIWLITSKLRATCTRASSRPPRNTQADPQAVAATNKLATWPAAAAPNHFWVGDITYLALATGQWAYLACWRDAFSRRVVG